MVNLPAGRQAVNREWQINTYILGRVLLSLKIIFGIKNRIMLFTKLGFFIYYYSKKHISKNLTAKDIFKRKLIRLMSKLPGSFTNEPGDEIIYRVDHVNGKILHLCIRGKSSSDVQVMDQVFASGEYLPLVEEITKRGYANNIHFIVDAGANVGYTTVYLKAYFPNADVVAIEPDDCNALQAGKNFTLNRFNNIKVIQGGIWSKDTWLELKKDHSDEKEWSYYVVECHQPSGLKGFSIESVLGESGYREIDLLKIDIEGSEKELFKDDCIIDPVLSKTKFLAIEIHDETGIRPRIYETLSRNGFEWFNRGELTIATNLRKIHSRTDIAGS
jgi:FkbM family methyltransferase